MITRKDLSLQQQAVQGTHAVADFCMNNTKSAKNWFTSKYLIMLEVKDENEIRQVIKKAQEKGIKFGISIEPDLQYQTTAIALEPCEISSKLTSSYPLMFKGK